MQWVALGFGVLGGAIAIGGISQSIRRRLRLKKSAATSAQPNPDSPAPEEAGK